MQTLLGFHRALLEHPCFVDGETCHGVVESDELARRAEEKWLMSHKVGPGPGGRLDGARDERRGRRPALRGDGARARAAVGRARARASRALRAAGGSAEASAAVVSPMQGTVLSVAVAEGDSVEAGRVVCVVEAMKMENEITAHRDGVVTELSVAQGQPVQNGQVICVLAQGDDRA